MFGSSPEPQVANAVILEMIDGKRKQIVPKFFT